MGLLNTEVNPLQLPQFMSATLGKDEPQHSSDSHSDQNPQEWWGAPRYACRQDTTLLEDWCPKGMLGQVSKAPSFAIQVVYVEIVLASVVAFPWGEAP